VSVRAGWAGLAAILAVTFGAAALALRYGVWTDGEPGPGLFPLLACALIAAAAPAVAFELARPLSGEPGTDESTPTPGRLATYLAVVLAWPLLLEPLGYAASSAVALMVLLVGGGVGWMFGIAITAGAVAGSYLLFDTLLEVPLPGPGWR
jgi:putative tricarboxylic transport membrane protein